MASTNLRNFSIIAHIDHGKSTLADRILELTGALSQREMAGQVLDDMELERERGITIKARAARLAYRGEDGSDYLFNLIDTPGHVDFAYEVSRSLAACEGVLLLVDAAQGVEAQTLANAYLAVEHDLEIIPVINKIDLPQADPDRVRDQLLQLGLDAERAVLVSAKTGEGVDRLLQAIIDRVPPPGGDSDAPLAALVFDSWFDSYRGVVTLVRVMEGSLGCGERIRLMATGAEYTIDSVGVFTPKPMAIDRLQVGEVGFLTAAIKELADTQIGDTITHAKRSADEPLPGFQTVRPMVFCGLYPTDASDVTDLREALSKLRLNDSSFFFEPETSEALGFGFRCGFLGLLHMEIIQERLEREYDLSLITTAPGVRYQISDTHGERLEIERPSALPPAQRIESMSEPTIRATIMTPDSYLGGLLKLCEDRRGEQVRLEFLDSHLVLLEYRLPLAEVILDFYDRLKSASRGYASMDYQWDGYQDSDLVRLDVLLNGELIDALSLITHRSRAYRRGRALVKKMAELIPRQQFVVVIQAAIGSRVIARETIRALRKNVTEKLYGGDVTRKRKLLEKQKAGKRRMKRVGRVDVPQEAFLALQQIA
ncbi:MAG: translation elongation factor 4 [Acidobacteriota bacterium]